MTRQTIKTLPFGRIVKTTYFQVPGSIGKRSVQSKVCRECALRIERANRLDANIRRTEVFTASGVYACELCPVNNRRIVRGETKGEVSAELVTAKLTTAEQVYINRQGYADRGTTYYGTGQRLYRVYAELVTAGMIETPIREGERELNGGNPTLYEWTEQVEETRANDAKEARTKVQRRLEAMGYTFRKPIDYLV